MKLQLAIVMGAILIGSLATVSMAFLETDQASANTLKSTAGMVGHVTLTVLDENGDIKAYRQLDNVVINAGDNCIAQDLFGIGFNCVNTTLNYDQIHIGSTNAAFGETSSNIAGWIATTGGSVGSPVTATGENGASVTVTAAFLDVNNSIAEAALMNTSDSAGGDVLALQNFSPIALGQNDDLTIEWTVTVDGD